MISRQDLERLASLKSDHGILTAYIRLDPRLRFVRQQAVSQFKGALKAAQQRIQQERWRDALERESSHVLDFLLNWEPAGRGVVIFSCRPEALWEVLPLEILVPNLVDIDTTTKTAILAEALEESPRFIVAVLQRDKARIYSAQQGTPEERLQLASEVPGQHKQGGRSQMRFQRHIDFHVGEHLKKVANEIERLAATRPFKLALGGTDENVEEVLKTLAEPIAKRVIGRFPVDYNHDTEQQILERAELVWKKREQFEEVKLVDQLLDAAKSGRQGVVGVEPTLSALVEEKVRTLLIVNGLAIDGSVCTRCDYFSAQVFKTCPLCGADAEQREVTDRAVEKAILTGADTEVVSAGEARDRLLAEGGLGALLRY
jgi:peptide chain release factor subunit 1